MLSSQRPDKESHDALLEQIGPLPLQGPAWPRWVVWLAWFVLAAVMIRLVLTATSPAGQSVSTVVKASVVMCVVGLAILARYMHISVTRITESGLEQSWIGRREIAWEDITFAKFIPLISSKKLICFTSRGRPVTFQAGSRELQIAFARIALLYRRR